MKKRNVREPDEKKIATLVRQLLVELGEDPDRDGLLKTPARVAKSLAFLTRGYRQTPKGVLNNAIFKTGANHMIVLRGIEVYSMCEHHMLPFFGTCAIGYIAQRKVLGVSNHRGGGRRRPGGGRGRGRGRGVLMPASLHDDARRGEAEFRDDHVGHARQFPVGREGPARVPLARQPLIRPFRREGVCGSHREFMVKYPRT